MLKIIAVSIILSIALCNFCYASEVNEFLSMEFNIMDQCYNAGDSGKITKEYAVSKVIVYLELTLEKITDDINLINEFIDSNIPICEASFALGEKHDLVTFSLLKAYVAKEAAK